LIDKEEKKMVGNNFKMPETRQLKDFEQQTVFKRPDEANRMGPLASSLGLTENLAGAFAYLFGFISGFIVLAIERENRFARFHAVQSIFVSIVFLLLFIGLGKLPFVGWFAEVILSPIGLVLWIILMLNAYDGKYSKILYIGNFAEKQFH
jgi:uncharacterized membrane protein